MRLESKLRTIVDLIPLRYQFGSSSTPGDWDANWLFIAGNVELAEGPSWSFTEPCLATWEARELASWFRGVVSGQVQAAPLEVEGGERLLTFTEPNLAFSLAGRDREKLTLRVHFSLGSRPPQLREDVASDLFAFSVEVALTHDALAAAVDEWQREIAAFPVR